MSKVFEALQRLERESGKLPPGILAEAKQVFQNGAPGPTSEAPVEIASRAVEEPVQAPIVVGPTPQAVEPTFDLASIPVENVTIAPETRIVYHLDPDSPGADRFRLLRMRLSPLWESGKLKTLLITSAQPQDGKSTVALNLATALAEQGRRSVLVIEGDLYRPSLAERLGLSRRPGLAECLETDQAPLPLLRRIEPLGWYLLPAGTPEGNPTELLQSGKLLKVFEALRPHFDWILVDSPPVLPLTDTLSLRRYVDAGLLVVRADRTVKDAVEAAVGRIGTQHLVGVVLNGSEEVDELYSDYRKAYGAGKLRNATKSHV
jgi:capsular exopolysaccharide synthesis family protein